MNVLEIVKEWLKANGYDGLVNKSLKCECRITVPEFMCESDGVIFDCIPAHECCYRHDPYAKICMRWMRSGKKEDCERCKGKEE